MFTPPFHPQLVHLPIALGLLAPLLALACLWGLRRAPDRWRLWSLVIVFQLLTSVTAWVALTSGESDARRLEAKPELREALAEHRAAGERYFVLSLAAVLCALLAYKPTPRSPSLRAATVALQFVLAALLIETAFRGTYLAHVRGAARVWMSAPPADAPGDP
jgi:uncharacterized membrane protein